MLTKKLVIAMLFGFILSTSPAVYAQEKPSEKKEDHSMIMNKDIQKCMDKIASDEHMRGMMMQKMMDQTKRDSTRMMQMCKMMMDNPNMHSMMMKMMHGEGGMMGGNMMQNDSTKTMSKSEHETHHKNK